MNPAGHAKKDRKSTDETMLSLCKVYISFTQALIISDRKVPVNMPIIAHADDAPENHKYRKIRNVENSEMRRKIRKQKSETKK